MIWWVVLFTVLPWGVKVPEQPEKGHADSAPERPMIGRKAAITSLISVVVWLVVFALVESGLISIRPE